MAVIVKRNKSYHELILLPSYKERFEYLKLKGGIGITTFGNDRYLNQGFYTSSKWKETRDQAIIRDNGCDLACEGFLIYGKIFVHHINPITIEDVETNSHVLYDLDNLICCSYETHLAIHYGNGNVLAEEPVIRKPNDTIPWR